MTSREVRELAAPDYVDNIHDSPDAQRSDIAFWDVTHKHKGVSERDLRLIGVYVMVVLRTGQPFDGSGIRLSDGMYLVPDKAVMTSALDHGIVSFDPATHRFLLTSEGLRRMASFLSRP